MNKQESAKDEKYVGASNATIALGQASTFGWIGKGVGAIVGAVASLLMTQEPGKYTEMATVNIKKYLKVGLSGRWAIAAGGALVGQWVGHYIGLAIGLKRATHGVGKGRAQFERVKAERNEAQEELVALKNDLRVLSKESPVPELVETAQSTLSTPAVIAQVKQGGHAAAIQAEQEAPQTELTR